MFWMILAATALGAEPAQGNFLPSHTTIGDRLLSFVGIFLLAGLAWALSENRGRVTWRPVLWGVGLQLLFGAIVLSPALSYFFFTVVDTGVNQLLAFSGQGATFVFQSVEPHFIQVPGKDEPQFFAGAISPPVKTFAFWILPTIIFFSSLMSLLYHLGVMQVVVKWIAKIMVVTLGTSGAESLSVAANIFVGQTEAPLLIRPFVERMTRSELNAVMVGGFATVAGGVMGAYVAFLQGIPNIAGHLVVASIISAPAALACAKLMVPETEHSLTLGKVEVEFPATASNAIEAAANGAADGLKLALNVAAMLMAIVALVAMFDWTISLVPVAFCADGATEFGYACVRAASTTGMDGAAIQAALDAGTPVTSNGAAVLAVDPATAVVTIASSPLSMATILGWVFAPIAFVMGVPWAECGVIGRLLGEKIVLTEFIAYIHLGDVIHAPVAQISERSAIIASYALCGFANFASIGIQLGGIGGMAPSRMSDLASLGFKAMVGGVIAACMTGAVAGVML